MIGSVFNKWTVIAEAGSPSLVKARCECGFEKVQPLYDLRNNRSKECINCRYPYFRQVQVGKKFGKWLVVSEVSNNKVECRCECGTTKIHLKTRLAVGATTKCLSCSNKENNTIHGNTASRSYNIWRQMIRRCVDPTFKGYKNYGGRGIKVCERWYKFQNFLFDMGEKPEGLQIDRTNNDGNYEPSNCRWVTPKQNCANRRIKVSGRD